MAEAAAAANWGRARNLNTITFSPPYSATTTRSRACLGKNHDFSLITRKSGPQRNRRRLLTISTTADGKWNDKWSTHYTFSLQQLHLQDLLMAEQQEDNQVSITLYVQKHASFGLSVDGKIMAYFTSKCSSCCSPYCRKIDTDFNVLILPSSRHSGDTQLPEIGSDDQVIYVKPGYEADLDSLIQDTIRLASSVKDTCSESCEKSVPRIQYLGEQRDATSIDGRWSRLLELRNAFQ